MSLVCFFFSSRRRHTRSLRDWSSDVCSSDLYLLPRTQHGGLLISRDIGGDAFVGVVQQHGQARSEERRVGKECRSWWSPLHYKKKQASQLVAICLSSSNIPL